MYIKVASPTPAISGIATRRVFHDLERRHLSPEALAMAYCLFEAQSVPADVTENTIQQAVLLGTVSGDPVDEATFEALLEAVTLNPSFRIPFSVASVSESVSTWVC